MGLFMKAMKTLVRSGKGYFNMRVPYQVNIEDAIGNTEEFENALRFAKQYEDIDGVREIINSFSNKYQNYKNEVALLANSEQTALNTVHKRVLKAYKQKNICKWLPLVFLLVGMVLPWFFPELIIAGFVISTILTIILFAKTRILFKTYLSCLCDVEEKARKIYEKYSNEIDRVKKQSDDMYLNSLDPAHRETVQMRREQQHFFEEQLQAQKLHQQKVEEAQERQLQAQRIQQQRQAKEQLKTLENQEELLRIERDREDRYYRNRK